MSARKYSYRPLETTTTIRVLVLEPAEEFQEPLLTALVHVDRDEILYEPDVSGRSIGNYECVSYCWGKAHFSETLECDGCVIKITKNVDNMLRHLRKSSRERLLWVDAICLNQVPLIN